MSDLGGLVAVLARVVPVGHVHVRPALPIFSSRPMPERQLRVQARQERPATAQGSGTGTGTKAGTGSAAQGQRDLQILPEGELQVRREVQVGQVGRSAWALDTLKRLFDPQVPSRETHRAEGEGAILLVLHLLGLREEQGPQDGA